MKTTRNSLSISDSELVAQICREAVGNARDGIVSLEVYRHFSALGFSRLRRNPKFTPLRDVEKQETAYLSAGLFIKAVLNGSYQPLNGISSEAFFWTICYRKAIEVLRKLSLVETQNQISDENSLNNPENVPEKSSFAQRVSLDVRHTMLEDSTTENEQIIDFLDREIIWKAVRQNLGDACFKVVYATVAEGRKNEDVWAELGYANPESFKTRKSKCMADLKKFIRPYFTH